MPDQSDQTIHPVEALVLKEWLGDGREIALLDVREHGQYGEAHLFFAVNVPFSRLENEIARLVPRLSARIVVYDDGDGIAERAAIALKQMRYTEVYRLAGGAPAWRAAGFSLFAGVNVPSKTFGELAEHFFATPRISARDLAARLAGKDDIVVLDGRPFTEYRKMNIPGATCCPNGELALHVRELVPSDATTIVVNCAGRTRSIIGAQTLINLGVPNPVLALENGTQGWYLDDLALEHGADRRHGIAPASAEIAALRERAQTLAGRTGVRMVDAATAQQWLADTKRTTFLCDVRTPEEFAEGSLPGAQHTPGGQLIQATDHYVGVQGARLILFDGEGVRAPVVASWLVQMGWEAVVLREGIAARVRAASTVPPPPPGPTTLPVADLAQAVARGPVQLVDIRASTTFRAGHIDKAWWSIRPRLDRLGLRAEQPVILVADEPGVAALVAATLREQGLREVRIHIGTPEAWRQAGLTVVATPDDPADSECIDFLFFVHDRHDGNKDAARQYLAWETNLISQVDRQERARFVFHANALKTGEQDHA